MKWATIRLPEDLYEEIADNLHEMNATSVSEVARKVLGDYIKQFREMEAKA